MRPSISRSRQVCRAFRSSTRRALSSKPPQTLPSTLQFRQVQPQRRWVSQTAPNNGPVSQATTLPPSPQTHYDFFPNTLAEGPPPTGPFHIDPRELRKEFLQLQAVAHPDRHPAALKTRAEATSARINEAYKALLNPLLRAQYLLSLRGIDVAEDETAKVEDPELLMEVLDAREEIENAQEEAELEELKSVNNERIEESEKVLDTAFREDNIDVAKGEAVRMRYWVNIKESLDNWERGKPVVLVH